MQTVVLIFVIEPKHLFYMLGVNSLLDFINYKTPKTGIQTDLFWKAYGSPQVLQLVVSETPNRRNVTCSVVNF